MYVITGLFSILSVQFSELGIDVLKLFSEYKTDIKILRNPVAKLDADIFGQYLEQVVKKSGNYRIGLEAGFRIPFNITGAFFNIYYKSDTVRDLFAGQEVFDSTANDIISYSTRTDGDFFYYEMFINSDFTDKYPVAARQWLEMQYGIALQYAYGHIGRFLYPVSACTVYAKEGNADLLEEYLNCPVKFSQDRFALVFRKSIKDLALATTNKEFLYIFRDIMDEIERKESVNNLTATVRRYLMHSLSVYDLDLDSVARRFNMSKRNLQRKLKEEDTSYQQILDNLRIEMSEKYLKERIPFSEITFLLGFESQSAFNKFFRKHFGITPGQFR